MRLRVRFAAVATLLASLAFAQDAAADLSDASLNAAEKRAIAASGLPRNLVVSAKPELVVAIRSRGAPSAGGGIVEGVVLQGEVVSGETAQIVGYRSMRSTVNIDCVRRRDMVTKMTVFAEHGAKGASVTRQVPGGWVQPSPDAYLGAVIRSICGSAPRTASAAPAPEPKPAPTKAAPSPPVQAKAPAPRAPRRDNVQVASAAPLVVTPREPPGADLDRPLRTSPDARLGRAMIATVTSAPVAVPTPAPMPTTAPKPKAPPPVAKASPPQTKAPAPRPATPGKVSVQIAAAATERQAREALAKQKSRVTAPLSTTVRSVTVDGKVFHRALVTGFQTRAEAQAFCSRLKAACFVR